MGIINTECPGCGRPLMPGQTVCSCGRIILKQNTYTGKRPFVCSRKEIVEMEEAILAEIAMRPSPQAYLKLAFVKYDYYKRKSLRTTPNYGELLDKADELGLTQSDYDIVFGNLGIKCPTELRKI